jgi:hypothetical protein
LKGGVKMFRVKSKITGGIYECVQYKGYKENKNEVISFIKDIYNLVITIIKPNIHVLDLELTNIISEIKEGSFVLRSVKDMPIYRVTNNLNNNYELINE